MKALFISIFIFLAISNNALVAQSDWSKARERNGITVFTRQSEGSSLKEFRAVTSIESTLSSVVSALMDSEGYTKWYADCEMSKTLKVVSPTELYRHSLFSAPWPVQDRDLVTRVVASLDKSNGSVTINLYNEKSFIPEREDAIRIPQSRGFWKLVPEGINKVNIEYQYLGDPGGNLPTWVINMFIVDGPYKSLMKLKEIVNQPQYQQSVPWLTQ